MPLDEKGITMWERSRVGFPSLLSRVRVSEWTKHDFKLACLQALG